MKYESFECIMCKREFSLKRNLKAHIKTHNSVRFKLKCNAPDCDKKYSKLSNLKLHYASSHRGVSIALVKKWLKKPRNQRITIEETPYQCHKCQKYFSKNSNLTTHLRIHDENKPAKVKCCLKGCGKLFVDNKNLRKHMRKIHGKEQQATSSKTAPKPKENQKQSSRKNEAHKNGSKMKLANLVNPRTKQKSEKSFSKQKATSKKIAVDHNCVESVDEVEQMDIESLSPHEGLRCNESIDKASWNFKKIRKNVYSCSINRILSPPSPCKCKRRDKCGNDC